MNPLDTRDAVAFIQADRNSFLYKIRILEISHEYVRASNDYAIKIQYD